jgi:uncharacterized protein (TIGR00297 family)
MPPVKSGGISPQGTLLQRTTQFSTADLAALIVAAALVVFHLVRRVESQSMRHVAIAAAVSAVFAFLAWIAHGVNWSGALAGTAVAFIFASTDLRLFWTLLLVFALTFAATRAGKARKQELRLAEASAGRSASQVMANLGVAALMIAVTRETGPTLALAALAEAAADTSSSEIGTAWPGKTVLLTSWKPVSPGVDGGVSLLGSLAALVGAAVIAIAAWLFHLVAPQYAFALALVGVLGSLLDSLLGALFERRGYLNNDLVNLLGTTAAALAMGVVTG